ncbi:hypothetical protein FPZ42_04015 [Mucilaginibacter achroorhodeus]|uniref:DUF5640 domain-containing protein n=1 Tax=Mucilaginibacter achroorhodeus TaxID=2599294 RepID=A0A563UAI5_9SPHI|nr:hypothetical protein [Mucilaginibacter achroorhodeus]TWR28392.1 hypothetical protein FPZ42_04015 [Mucilaginibacter achroorhodeus]
MKTFALVFIHVTGAVLGMSACHTNTKTDKRLHGTWKSKDGAITLKITDKQFTMADGEAPIPEDYFMKADTIFTSFEGNQPYTKFVIKKLDDRSLSLVMPDDTVAVEFSK